MDIAGLLSQTRLFAELPPAALERLAQRVVACGFPGGARVFEVGGPPDCLYLVASGRLRAETADGQPIAEIGHLEPIGEVGVLSGEPRTANVYAVRDSVLLRLDREALIEFLLVYPKGLLALSQAVISRLRQGRRSLELDAVRRPRSLAVVGAHPAIDARRFASLLHAALTACSRCQLLDSAAVDQALGSAGSAQAPLHDGEAEARLSEYLAEQETAHKHLVYVADPAPGAWSQRCLRQADRILLLVDGDQLAAHSPMTEALRKSGIRAPVDLVVLRGNGVASGRVGEWLSLSGATGHYFFASGDARDAGLIARSLTGRAVGLVLGGGGARGFAHLGLLQAIEELGIPVDLVGGSSMGAFLGALLACGHSAEEIRQLTRDTFVSRNLLNDFLFPRVALIRGRKFVSRLQELFGDRRIEELRKPFYCVSTNLTRGRGEVHANGPLAIWVATSMAIPGVVAPVAYRGDLLADGAVINSLPTDEMVRLGRGPIVASDVSTEGAIGAPGIEGPDPEGVFRQFRRAERSGGLSAGRDTGRRPTLISILFRTATLTNEANGADRAQSADVYLRMPVSGIGLFEWKRLDECRERGYEFARERLEAAKPLLLGSP